MRAMPASVGLLVLLGTAAPWAPSVAADISQRTVSSSTSPVRKVINLLMQMKASVERDAAADKISFDKYMCWCLTTKKEKSQSIDAANQRLQELSGFLEEAAATSGQLKAESDSLKSDISDAEESLASAAAMREKDSEAFKTDQADMKETRQLLGESVAVLSKVQLVQRHGPPRRGPQPTPEAQASNTTQAAEAALLQVRKVVARRRPSQLREMLQRDLFDMLGSLGRITKGQDAEVPPRRRRTGLGGSSGAALVQEDTAQPNELEGNIAGAQSYNARSSSILGIMQEMQRQITRDLANAQKKELSEEEAYQKMRAAKSAELAASRKLNDKKEDALAELKDKIAKGKADVEMVSSVLETDRAFLSDAENGCSAEDRNYEVRSKERGEEIRTLAEALGILTDEDARGLYAKTMSFAQLGQTTRREAVSQAAKRRSVQTLSEVARRHRSWSMAALAVSVQQDSFVNAKKVMDTMLNRLKKEQKDEAGKVDFCKLEIDKTEDQIKDTQLEKEDLGEQHLAATNTFKTLAEDMETLTQNIETMESSLKKAGENRKQESRVFQVSVADQRGTIKVLEKVSARLQKFYSFYQHQERKAPPTGNYEKRSMSAGGVLDLLAHIVSNAQREVSQLEKAEQASQKAYEALVVDAKTSIEAAEDSIEEKKGQQAEAASEKSELAQSLSSKTEAIEALAKSLHARHLECDFVLKHFKIRQQARAEEMEAITDAKAILSGADFGES